MPAATLISGMKVHQSGGIEGKVYSAGVPAHSLRPVPTAKRICPFGHATRAGQNRCLTCGERLVIVVQDDAGKNGSAQDHESNDQGDESREDRPEEP